MPRAKRLCDRLTEASGDEELAEWDIYKATRELRQSWEQKSIRNGMKVAGKGVKTTTEVGVRAIQDHKVIEWNTCWKCRLSEDTNDM